MALFARKKQDDPGAIDGDHGRLEIDRRPQTIGAQLAEARQRHGAEIEDIGAALRIRPAFLKAIEEDQFAALPGPVYALGFVRTYADYLGLDGEMFARRFKSEINGLESKRDLSFPMPLPERGLPGGAILLVALIVGACAYAVWYYRASGDHERPERVAAVPQQLIPLPPAVPKPPPAAPTAETPSGDTTAAAPSALPSASVATAPTASPTASSTTSPGTSPATSSATSPGSASAASSSPLPSIPPAPAPPVAPEATASAASTDQGTGATATAGRVAVVTPTAPAVPPSSSSTTTTATADPSAIPAVPAAVPLPEGGRVFGITNGPVRIVIKAAGDSWVQVRDANGVAVQTRTLRNGDTLRVPDLPGLTMRAGNSGALQITLDGKPVPAIGPVGKARSAALDPAKLAAGTATLE